MRQAKKEVILHEIYFDTEYQSQVMPDSIKDTSKGPYVHYKRLESGQWGRKPLARFLERFKLTQPIDAVVSNYETVKPVLNVDNNVIYIDFLLKRRLS